MKNLKIFSDNIDEQAAKDINLLLAQPAFANAKVRIMPDVHAGKGCVIGFTAHLGEKVIPNVVGVDIGCGMLTIGLNEQKPDLEKLDEILHNVIPHGMRGNTKQLVPFEDFCELRCVSELVKTEYLLNSIGSLGGGNHFVEVDRNKDGQYFLVIHTGSRNLGLQVCNYYQKNAIQYCSTLETIPPNDLCYLESSDRLDYLHDMEICQKYAKLNRETIANIILEKLSLKVKWCFETVHNYISFEDNIVRKGAIRAKKGQHVLIPINMRDGCIIGLGKGNDDWNCSAPHGAGRIMSRKKAKENLSMDDFKKSMEGIYTTSVLESTIDEAPMVYKPMDEILSKIGDTVEVIDIIKPIYNFKSPQ